MGLGNPSDQGWDKSLPPHLCPLAATDENTPPQAANTLDGRFSHLEGIAMEPKPVQKPSPPIWFGGHAEAALRRAVELGDAHIGAGSTPMHLFLEDIKQLPANFPKAKRLHLALRDNLPRLREWFGTFYGKPEMADQVAVWGSPLQIADQIVRLGNAGVYHVLNPVFDEEAQMQQLCQDALAHVLAGSR